MHRLGWHRHRACPLRRPQWRLARTIRVLEIWSKPLYLAMATKLLSTRRSGQTMELSDRHSASTTRAVSKCHLAISANSENAAIAFATASGIFVRLIDLSRGEFAQSVEVPRVFPIQFDIYGLGFIGHTSQLAISQSHYRPTGEPEIITQQVSSSGILEQHRHRATGYAYSEVYASSYDYGRDRVWLLCPPVSARIDRQPRCTLTSASLTSNDEPALEVPTTARR